MPERYTQNTLRRCEIAGCGCLVMGCEMDDGCPATRLCPRHYFLMSEICKPENLRALYLRPSNVFGEPSERERVELILWHARYILPSVRENGGFLGD